jgi:hypothetical protein
MGNGGAKPGENSGRQSSFCRDCLSLMLPRDEKKKIKKNEGCGIGDGRSVERMGPACVDNPEGHSYFSVK